MKRKDELNSIYGVASAMSIHKDRGVRVKYMTEKDKNKILQCAIDFGYVDTDNIQRLIKQQTIINREV